MTVEINGTTGISSSSGQFNSASTFGFKNRIINGAMRIDQRNAGASVNPSGTAVYNYIVDRWAWNPTQASKMTWGQNLNSIAPPAGFASYFGGQVGAAANVTVGSGDYFFINQAIEGFNIADFGFGTSAASSITLSFWVRSSLTGTFGGTLENAGLSRGYPFTYTINSANTWEQKTITFAGDTTGTWGTGNGVGVNVRLAIGVGSAYKGAAGSWQAINTVSATGAVDLIATNGATFYITGVQLEKGSTATSFDYRPYGTELRLCQRYLPAYNRQGNDAIGVGQSISATQGLFFIPFQVTPRIAPTGISASTASGFYAVNPAGTVAYAASSVAIGVGGSTGATLNVTYANNGGAAGQANTLYSNTAGAQILFTGCEL